MGQRTLYLQRGLSVNGRTALGGRTLYDRFREQSEEMLLGYVVWNDEAAERVTNAELKPDIISHSLYREFRPSVIYMEGGLFYDSEGSWRVPETVLRDFCQNGGILIVADVDCNELRQHKAHYDAASRFFGTYARYGTDAHSADPVYGADETRHWRGVRQILCNPAKMIISDWAKPIYDGIPEILVGIPGCLSYNDSIIASCNEDTTGILHLDRWIDRPDPCAFASAIQMGDGFAALVAGNVSGDAWLQGCKHNTAWLTQIAAFLAELGAADAIRRRSHRRSPHLLFLSHRSIDKPSVLPIAKTIKNLGVNVWLDEEQLVPSQSLTGEISSALGKMTHFVLFWSSNCIGAPWVQRELNSAIATLIEREMPIIIVRLDNTAVPPILADILRVEAFGLALEQVGERIVGAVARLAQNPSTAASDRNLNIS